MTKILLVEDSPVQIEWAKKELRGYELIIKTNNEEALEELFRLKNNKEEFIYIGDLLIPESKISPSLQWRGSLFLLQVAIGSERCLGACLVSNYEHHKDGYEKGEEPKEQIFENYGTMVSQTLAKGRYQIHFDRVWYGDFYSHVWINGRAETKSKENWQLGELLKPYGKIIENMGL